MPTTITIDGLPVFDLPDAREALDALGYPEPELFRRANSVLNPLGSAPCRAWLLVTYQVLSALAKESTSHQIGLGDAQGNTLTLYNFVFVKARCVVPGVNGATVDPKALFLAEFADRSWLVDNPTYNVPINLQYNTPAPASGGGYYYESTNAGTPWTWATMWANLWTTTVGPMLGAAPALPVTPNGLPTAFIFPGLSGWNAVNQFLTRIGCAININPLVASNQFSVVQVGATDAATTALTTQSIPRKIHTEHFVESQVGKAPSGVTVYFHRANADYGTENTTGFAAGDQWSTQAVYTVSIPGPSGVGASGTYHPIWDDLQAIYNASGTLTNGTALTARAQERANDYYRWIQAPGGDFVHATYSGLIPFDTGAQIRGVAFRQDENGALLTEIVRHPYGRLIISNAGEWEEEDWDSSTALQPPDFRPAYPNYPHYLQTVKLTTGTADGSGRFAGVVELYDPAALAYSDRETCWAVEANGLTSLSNGARYFGRLSGFNDGAPLYQIDARSGTASSAVVFEVNQTAATVATTYDLVASFAKGGGDGSTYKATLASTPGTGTLAVDCDRQVTVSPTCLQVNAATSTDMKADLAITLQTSPTAASAVVGTLRNVNSDGNIRVNGGTTTNLAQDVTLALSPTIGTTITFNAPVSFAVAPQMPGGDCCFNAYLYTLTPSNTLTSVFNYSNPGDGLQGTIFIANPNPFLDMTVYYTAVRAIPIPGLTNTLVSSFTMGEVSTEQIDVGGFNNPWTPYLPLGSLQFSVSAASVFVGENAFIEVSINAPVP